MSSVNFLAPNYKPVVLSVTDNLDERHDYLGKRIHELLEDASHDENARADRHVHGQLVETVGAAARGTPVPHKLLTL
jgi:hypothetical protein